MKKSLLLAALLDCASMSGCSRHIQSYEIEKAVELCKEHKGLHELDVFTSHSVTCNDGSFAWVK